MLPALFDHVWQSTLFAAAAGLLTLALRKNRAQIRYCLWLAASLKFLLPFSLLVAVGGYFSRPASAPAVSTFPFLVEKVSEPFAGAARRVTPSPDQPRPTGELPQTLAAIWALGFVTLATSWWLRSRRLRAAVRAAAPVILPIGVRARSSRAFSEPGILGIFRPVLLLPEDLPDQLTEPQLRAVLAHELCHIRRRDNLAAALHRTVEAVFWFYPRVWWIGARLLEERERACDEEVLRLGHQPQAYAEGILRICELSLAAPPGCVAGVTGGNLKSRIEDIMHHRAPLRLDFAKQALLTAAAAAAIAVPILFGFMTAPRVAAQTAASTTAAAPEFEVASIKPCAPGEAPGPAGSSPGRLSLRCMSVIGLINQAYVLYYDGNLHLPGARFVPVEGGPDWARSQMYSIEAKAEGAPPQGVMMGPMLKTLLADRFHLKIRTESRDIPAYVLTVAKGGPKLQAAQKGDCRALDLLHPPAPGQKVLPPCTRALFLNGELNVLGATMPEFAAALSSRLDRDIIDRTGIQGVFDIRVALPGVDPAAGLSAPPPPPGAPAALTAPAGPVEPAGFLPVAETVARKLGLKLESGHGPGQFLVIDHVEKPSPN